MRVFFTIIVIYIILAIFTSFLNWGSRKMYVLISSENNRKKLGAEPLRWYMEKWNEKLIKRNEKRKKYRELLKLAFLAALFK